MLRNALIQFCFLCLTLYFYLGCKIEQKFYFAFLLGVHAHIILMSLVLWWYKERK